MDSADTTVDDRPIVVGVDGSDSARDAAEWAADLAAIWDAPLHLLTAVLGTAAEPASGLLAELRDAAVRAGARTVVAETVQGEIVDVIAERARDARMLVLGSYGEGAWSGMLAEAVAVTLLNRATCPIVVVRGTAPQIPPPRGGPVVVGVDGSPAGASALALAADLAASLGSRLVAVHAWTDIVVASDGSGRRSHGDQPVLAARAATLLDAELAEIALTHPGLPVERSVVADTPLSPCSQPPTGTPARPRPSGQRCRTGTAPRLDKPGARRVRPVSGRGDRTRGPGRADTAPGAGHRGDVVTTVLVAVAGSAAPAERWR
jgi:nucleotide-binding universal stress UspA family protein